MTSATRWIPTVLVVVFPILFVKASALTTFFSNIIKRPGEDFVAGCQDVDPKQEIRWSGPFGPLNGQTKPQVEVTPHGTLLSFKNPIEKESGNYTCSTKTESKVVSIQIKFPLVFVDTPIVQTAVENQTQFVIKCEVTGGIKPILSWYTRNGEATKPKFRVLADGLLITNVTAADGGVYICKATERVLGDVNEINITLKVEHKPYPNEGSTWMRHEPAWGFLGSTVNLTCEGVAEPPPRFEWKQPIKNHGKIYNSTYSSILQVNITNEKVFGNYSCKISNKHGTLSKVVTLEPGEQPLPPQLVEQQAENSDLLDIGIEPPNAPMGLMRPTGFVVQYRLADAKKQSEEHTWMEHHFDINSKNSYILRDLQSDSKYEVRVATKNVAGLSQFTNISRFFTLESVTLSSSLPDGASIYQHFFLTICAMLLVNNW